MGLRLLILKQTKLITMKVFYKKEVDGAINEIVFYDREIDETVHLTVTKSLAAIVDDEVSVLFSTTYPNRDVYNNMLNSLTKRLNNYGWQDDYYAVVDSVFPSYNDGEYLPSKITRIIDSVENLSFPVYVHEKPKGFRETYFNKGFRDLVVIDNKEVFDRATAVQDALFLGLNCYVKGNELIVHDLAILNTPYLNRCSILTEVEMLVEIMLPVRINSKAELMLFCEGKEEVVIKANSMYVPGGNPNHSYIYSIDPYTLTDLLVMEITDTEIVCTDLQFNNFITIDRADLTSELRSGNLKVSDIISYECKI